MLCIYVLCRALAPPQDRHVGPRPLAIKGAPVLVISSVESVAGARRTRGRKRAADPKTDKEVYERTTTITPLDSPRGPENITS
ncbi:hypothetical protein Y032_0043g736 [Ancylostoma ceylanicum]|nr:hypothetical protein Y032_0043g736 [Ancylostoma ceylanicum]